MLRRLLKLEHPLVCVCVVRGTGCGATGGGGGRKVAEENE